MGDGRITYRLSRTAVIIQELSFSELRLQLQLGLKSYKRMLCGGVDPIRKHW
jgi:hypothetical protein